MDGIADRGGIVSGISWGSDYFSGDQGAAEQSGADDMCRSFVYWSGGCICRCCDQQRMEDEQGRIQFKQEMPEKEEAKEEKEAPIDTEEQSDSE